MPGMHTAYPKLIDSILVNPGMGFQHMYGYRESFEAEGKVWEEKPPLAQWCQQAGKPNHFYPESTLDYYRVYWCNLEPREGEYHWEIFERALKRTRELGRTLCLRAMSFGSEPNRDVPDWFRQRLGPNAPDKHPYWRCVDPEDPRYLEAWCRFVRAFGEHFDGHPDIEYVDLALLGFWGEGEATAIIGDEARRALVDAYVDAFPNTVLVAQMTDFATNQYGLSRRPDMGWRIDCLGDMRSDWCHMMDVYPQDIVNCGLEDTWKKGPVSLEACWVMQHWFDQGWDVDYIIEKSLQWHISSFNGKSSLVPREWESQVAYWLKHMGYRFAPRKVAFSGRVAPGGTLQYDMWWENRGVSPVYHRHDIALRVTDGTHTAQVVLADQDIRTLLPGDSVLCGKVILPDTLPEGAYQLQLAVLGRDAGRPNVSLAIEGRTADGWYPMGPIEIARDE
nr:DUF4832 domain-containing protein [bacterium]